MNVQRIARTICSSFLLVLPFSLLAQYWQQEVHSKIEVELHPETNRLNATIEIEYINHSPNTLHEIYFHLWANAHSSKETKYVEQQLALGNKEPYVNADKQFGSIDELSFMVDGISAKHSIFENQKDIAVLKLNEPLLPGKAIQITTPFQVQLPPLKSRMGVDGHLYSITQWYPKPAVYDHEGWHPMSYLDIGEFYGEFGSFDVKITLPSNMVVAATGELQTESEIDWLGQIAQATQKGIENDYEFEQAKLIKNRHGQKTIHFQQDLVHDFAWFASKDFFVLEELSNVKNQNDDNILLQSFFPEESVFQWENTNNILKNSLQFMTDKVGIYPYQNYKAVGGTLGAGSGMEYPMVTIIGENYNDLQLKHTIIHEFIHSYFQGVLGNDERRFAWLDESLTSFYTEWLLAEEVDVKTLNFESGKEIHDVLYSNQKSLPIQTNSENYNDFQYYESVYSSGAKAINYLREYLGDEQFTNSMKSYYQNWQFKHPSPSDFQKAFATEKDNLNWWLQDIIQQNKPIDYQLVSVKNGIATVKNKGEVAAPFTLDFVKDNQIIETTWVDGFSGEQNIELSTNWQDAETVSIFQRPIYFETNRANNARTINNKKVSPLKVNSFWSSNYVDSIGKSQPIFVSPILGWNASDKFMLGGMITNTRLIKKPFEYEIYPMYSLHTKDVNGLAKVEYHIPSKKDWLKEVDVFASTRHFNFLKSDKYELDYYRNEFGAELKLNHKEEFPTYFDKRLKASAVVNLVEPRGYDPILMQTVKKPLEPVVFYNLQYNRKNERAINPNQLNVSVQGHQDFAKASASYQYRYDFAKPNRFVRFRSFLGTVIAKSDEMPFRANFSATSRTGLADYDFSHLMLSREMPIDFASNQIYEADGGLKVARSYATLGEVYGKTMAAINLEPTLPIELPFGQLFAYADLVAFDKVVETNDQKAAMLYNAGVSFQIKDFIKVYYPLLLSDEFKPETDIEPYGFKEKVSFQLNIRPFEMKDKLRKKF